MSRDLHKAGANFCVGYTTSEVDHITRIGGAKGGNVFMYFDLDVRAGDIVTGTRHRQGDVIFSVNGTEMEVFRVNEHRRIFKVSIKTA